MRKLFEAWTFVWVFLALLVVIPQTLFAGEPVKIETALISDALPISAPLFSDSLDIKKVLETDYIKRNTFSPSAADELTWFANVKAVFKSVKIFGNKLEFPLPAKLKQPHLAYSCFYLSNERYQSITLELTSELPLGLFINGEKKYIRSSVDGETSHTEIIELSRGKHLVIVKALFPGDRNATDINRAIAIEITPQHDHTLAAETTPTRTLARYDDLRFIINITDLAVSPDGSIAAAVLRSREVHDTPSRTWIELWDTKKRERVMTVSMGKTTNSPIFFPDSRSLLYRTYAGGGSTLWLMDLDTKETTSLITGLSAFRQPVVHPSGNSLLFLGDVETESDEDDPKFVKYDELRDRLPDWYTGRAVFEIALDSGTLRQLSASGEFMVQNFDLSPDGSTIVYSRMLPFDERPFYTSELWLQDIRSGEGRLIYSETTGFENSPLNLTFSPDGKQLAFSSAPGPVGNSTEVEHNIYNSDLYIMDIESGSVEKATEGFLPAVVERARRKSVAWSKNDNHIYFLGIERARRNVFRADPRKAGQNGDKHIEIVKLEPANVEYFSNLSDGGLLLASGSSLYTPPAVFIHRTDKNKCATLIEPNAAFFSTIQMGSMERFDFVNERENTIDGWIFKPHGFDASKKYPVIVYYYAGVSPRLERFTLAYHWLNANGYVVYVLNPSGAYGAGDEFANLHVNDWGTVASADVIEGVTKLIKDKTYVDADKIGAYGGSYGGFITLDLVTKTDLFGAVCSLFGISNLASHWGAGVWGVTYGDMAMARSYPWKNRDIFVEKSPLFHADKVNTPTLLLHGRSDANVTVHESQQMFSAMKVLGKEVVLVEFLGEDHGISGTFDNLVIHREMMLEWFDKHLKDDSAAWDARWEEE